MKRNNRRLYIFFIMILYIYIHLVIQFVVYLLALLPSSNYVHRANWSTCLHCAHMIDVVALLHVNIHTKYSYIYSQFLFYKLHVYISCTCTAKLFLFYISTMETQYYQWENSYTRSRAWNLIGVSCIMMILRWFVMQKKKEKLEIDWKRANTILHET